MTESSISDHIGRLGKIFFDNLANKAKLLIGKIEPDRVGKDRVIEFELSPRDEKVSFDKRPAPLGCAIQIKTILAHNDRVALSLSVAERLAGDVRPAIICILRVNDNDDVVDMHLVHLLGDNLGRILKRLRQEFADGNDALNNSSITFGIAGAEPVALTPMALKETLSSLIGPNMEAYAVDKMRERNNLGYNKENRYSINVTFDKITTEEFVEGMLGLRRLKLKSVEPFEERFDVKLPDYIIMGEDTAFASLEVQPIPRDTGTLSFRDLDSELLADLKCDLFAPDLNGLPIEHLKVIARSRLLYAVVGIRSLKFQAAESFCNGDPSPLSD